MQDYSLILESVKSSYRNFFKPIGFLIFAIMIYFIKDTWHLSNLESIMMLGITSGFFIGSIISIKEKQRNIDLLVFVYFALAISLVLQDNLFYIFIILEVLTIVGAIFIVVDSDSEKYGKLKEIAIRYFLTHVFAGLIFMSGILILITNNKSLLISNLENSLGYYLIIIALLINCAVPFFSFWLVQSYSNIRFSSSIFMMSVVTKISLFFLFIMHPKYLDIIGIVTIIYCSLLLLREMNIRRFLCYALISHNGLFLFFISKSPSYENFSNLMINSFFAQNLLVVIIFIISHNAKSYFFLDIERNIRKYKLMFFLSLIANWIFISLPYTPGFNTKFIVLYDAHYSIYFVVLINIFLHIFLFNYKIFSTKPVANIENDSNNYVAVLTAIIPIIIIYYFQSSPQAVSKYFGFLIIVGFIFIITRKLFSINYRESYDISFLFQFFKLFLNFLFTKWKIVESYFGQSAKKIILFFIDYLDRAKQIDSFKTISTMLLIFCIIALFN